MRILIDVFGGKVGMVWATDADDENGNSNVYARYDYGPVEKVPEWDLNVHRIEDIAELEDGPDLALYDEQQAEAAEEARAEAKGAEK